MAFYFGPSELSRRELYHVGAGRFAEVPFLLSEELVYLDDVNRFLRQRAWGEWTPNSKAKSEFATRKPLSDNTLRAYARDLDNFFTYLEIKELDWRFISYTDVIEKYERDLSSGAWSASGEPLENSTINRRGDRSVEFLQWASEQGLRGDFALPTETVSRRISDGRSARMGYSTTEVRIGRRRVHPKRLRLPTIAEINRWLSEIKARYGSTKARACQFVIDTGCRLEETVLFRADQLPDPDTISLDRPARMEICYGTKGGRTPGDPEKKGKQRTLRFERDALVALHNYRQLGRLKALEKLGHSDRGKDAPRELFLNEATGMPLTRDALYRAWHNTTTLPFVGFSPHAGRHTFACFTLLRLLEEEFKLIQKTIDVIPRSAVFQAAENLVDIYLKPVLGHVSGQTTERYLEWVGDHLWVARHRAGWSSFLESDPG